MINVTVTVRDRHFDKDNSKNNDYGELVTLGTLEADGGELVVNYRETVEEPNDCQTMLRISGSRITMMREGRFRTNMIFENHKRHTACYETPFGEAMIGIYTNAMFVDMCETGGVVDFAYTIDFNGDLVSENELKITIAAKED